MKDPVTEAARILRQGGLVAFPTETVYGLGADAENELAIRRIFAVKGRPSSHPLIVHLPDASAMDFWAREISPAARTLASAFWPGALTLVVPRSARALDAVTGGQDTVALRVPASPMAQALLRQLGRGIAAPSANRFGKVSPTTAEHVRADLGDEVDLILDGGACAIGVESTIVNLTGREPTILRPGGVPREQLERVLGQPISIEETPRLRAPGVLPTHYAPRAGVVLTDAANLGARAAAEHAKGLRVAVIASGNPRLGPEISFFPVPEDPAAFAHVLYATLREIDLRGFDVVVAALPPSQGLGLAVGDRLTRAAKR